ncbi:MAG: cbb3-type cytochrome c oxidase subunit I [Acidiferrobacterales bacterium]
MTTLASTPEEEHTYISAIPQDERRSLAIAWLTLGLLALLGSGIFSILLVMSRTPYVQNIFPWVDFFRTALVVHVDLSVLVWFLAFAGLLWTLNSTERFIRLGWVAFILAASGAAAMALSPFIGADQPLMSNYIPVLRHPAFLLSLLSFAAGFTLLVGRSMIAIPRVGHRITAKSAYRFGLNTLSVSAVMALMAFVWSYAVLPTEITAETYYELLFWGGGHMLQFTYTLLTLVAWLWLASVSGIRLPLSPRVVVLLFFLGLVTVFMAPLIYYSYPVGSAEHIQLFTWLMAYGGSLATLPLGLALLIGWLGSSPAPKNHACLRSALLSSMFLFGIGGAIGFLIQGSNVTIPAHYHGSIVGVTLALMGLTYDLLPRLGFQPPDMKWSRLQPYVYGGGQFLHVVGLVWSGGYGVQRKVAGVEQGLDGMEKIAAMGLMGLGGLIAILGGLLFLVIVFYAMKSGRGD